MRKNIKNIVSKIMSIETFKIVFLIVCFFYTFPFTSVICEKIFKINIVWCMFIALYDHFKSKKLRLKKCDFALIAMLCFAFLSTIINYKNNLYANLIVVIYMAIQAAFMLLYDNKKTRADLMSELKKYAVCVLILTFICAVASIAIYLLDIKMSINNGYQEVLIGAFEGRLWSIYGNPNTLGHFSLISIIFSFILLELNKLEEKKGHKKLIYTNILVQWICLLLSNSRSTLVAGVISVVIYAAFSYALKNKSKDLSIKQYLLKNKIKTLGNVVVTIIVVALLSTALKYSMPVISSAFNFIKLDDTISFGTAKESVERQNNGSADSSNGRFEIWKAGLNVFKQYPMFGVGMKNVNEMANKYMLPETVEITPKMSENMHNVYLQVLVSHGIFAAILFIGYLAIVIIKALKYLFNNVNDKLYKLVLYYFLLMTSICTINLFDSNLLYFFSLFIVPIFWTSICNMNRLLDEANKSEDKKDVLILIDSLAEGGAEKVLVDVVNNINMDKYNIEVRSVYNEGIYREQLNDKVKYTSIIKRPNIWKKRIINRVIKYFPSRLVYMIFIDGKYDVEVAFLEFLATKILTGSSSNAVKIAWLHTGIFTHKGSTSLFLSRKQLLKGYQKFDKIISVAKTVNDEFCKNTNLYQETVTIYNPVDKKNVLEKSKLECDFTKDESKFTIMSIGRLVEVKGYIRLCKAINKLKDKYSNLQLVIIGEGDERKKLEEYIKENKLDNVIKLLGFKENPYSYLKQADLFVSCSFVEGFSLVLAEALTLDIPVFSTRTAGAIDLLEDGKYGLVVENNEDGIYDGLDKILSNKDMLVELKEKAKERKEFFDITKTISKIEEVFDLKRPINKSGEVFCTVFTPAYNRAYTLEKLYSSLKKQTYKDFEWLVIDDGSVDNTEELFKKWLKDENDFEIRYIKVQNGGKQRAVNKGIDLAKGKMFFIVDSDDYLTDNALEKLFEFERTISNLEDFVGVSGFRGYDVGNYIGAKINKEYIDCKNTERDYYGLFGDKAEAYYTDLLKRYKFPEIPNEKFVSERVLWDKLANDGYKIRWFNEIIYICEYLEGGLTNQGVELYKRNPKGYLCFVRNMDKYNDISLLAKLQNYYGYYDAVKENKSKKEIAVEIGTTKFMINLAIFAKKVKDIIKK